MAECGYCGTELADEPPRPGPRRRYCCDNHKAYACLLRKAERDAMDSEQVAAQLARKATTRKKTRSRST